MLRNAAKIALIIIALPLVISEAFCGPQKDIGKPVIITSFSESCACGNDMQLIDGNGDNVPDLVRYTFCDCTAKVDPVTNNGAPANKDLDGLAGEVTLRNEATGEISMDLKLNGKLIGVFNKKSASATPSINWVK
jgi:hypothetical protein